MRIKELGLLARSVFVVDRAGKVTYREIVSEVTHEPDYAKAIEADHRALQQRPASRDRSSSAAPSIQWAAPCIEMTGVPDGWCVPPTGGAFPPRGGPACPALQPARQRPQTATPVVAPPARPNMNPPPRVVHY